MPEAFIILCTCGTHEEAERIARTLVAEGLAACVNIVPGIRSIYRWQGKIEESAEELLLIKTTGDNWNSLESRVRELHSYDTPEILKLAIAGGSQEYLGWLIAESHRGTPGE